LALNDAFEQHRKMLFAAAYRIVGSRDDAEDVMQDTWLSWRGLDPDSIEDARPYLYQMVTRRAIDHRRRMAIRREAALVAEPATLGIEEDSAREVELADAVSAGLRVVLETLSPIERAVFLLHEVFGFSHAEIASSVGRTERAVRQLAYRARRHVLARRARYRPSSAEHRDAVTRFRSVSVGGSVMAHAQECGSAGALHGLT
jgi:RNA polymerase sigma-70 factor (ECF subfamily)